MAKIELLAPAKNKEIAIEAINCGADAVYIGATDFGARKNAGNSLEDIKEVIDYAHKFWVKVYITINTILTNSELDNVVELALQVQNIGADGIIIQDMGLLNRLMTLHYTTPIHISTQCDNYLPEKIKFFNDVGVQRVVVARECSIEKIKSFHENNPDLELETFIHGALCVSFSGQCYLSQYIGGRSANRGECAQPCRKKYTVEDKNGNILKKDFYALCLKDFNASDKLDDLINAGVTSFKIEGRLKDINYVKNIVSYYAQKLNNKSSSGKSTYPFTPQPDKSFNRGFTEYFLTARTNCFNYTSPKSRGEYLGKVVEVKTNCFKLATSKQINPQDGLCYGDNGFLVNKVEKEFIYPNKKIQLKIGTEIYRNLDVQFEKELSKPVKRKIGVNIIVKDGLICITDEDGVSVTKKLPTGEIAKNQDKMNETFIKQFSKTGESDFYIKDFELNDNITFLPISVINDFRRRLFDELMTKRIDFYNKNKKLQKSLKYTKYFLDAMDYRANVSNDEARKFYESCGCKITEPALEIKVPERQVTLMRCKHCIKYALNMCKSPLELYLRDDHNNTYLLEFDCKNCEMSVLSNCNF